LDTKLESEKMGGNTLGVGDYIPQRFTTVIAVKVMWRDTHHIPPPLLMVTS
jgi:hypothetical protein